MLSIRPDQMQVFSGYVLENFRERMVQRIADVHPKRLEELGKPAVEALVDRLLKEALKHGIQKDNEVAAFIELFLNAGPRSEEQLQQPWARKILAAPALAGGAKVGLLSLTLTGRLPQS